MIKLLFKSVIWLVAGIAVVYTAVPLTGFRAASPWRLSVNATGNVEGGLPALGTLDDPVTLSVGEVVDTTNGEIGTIKIDETLDLGVVSFLVVLYTSGTAMGYLLKRRRRSGFTEAA